MLFDQIVPLLVRSMMKWLLNVQRLVLILISCVLVRVSLVAPVQRGNWLMKWIIAVSTLITALVRVREEKIMENVVKKRAKWYSYSFITEPDPCTLAPEAGPCTASITRFYYNVTTQTCQQFSYGGCFPNENNFFTQHDCEEKCSGKFSYI